MLSQDEPIREVIAKIISSIIPFDEMEEEHLVFAKRWVTSGEELFRCAKPDQPSIHLVS